MPIQLGTQSKCYLPTLPSITLEREQELGPEWKSQVAVTDLASASSSSRYVLLRDVLVCGAHPTYDWKPEQWHHSNSTVY